MARKAAGTGRARTTTLWVAGRNREGSEHWEILGVYSTEDLALARCTSVGDDFVAPCTLNVAMPEAYVPGWPGCYYPAQDECEGARLRLSLGIKRRARKAVRRG